MMGKESRFFTFPIELLRGAFTDMRGVCDKIVCYAVFVRCNEYEESPKEAFEFFRIDGNYDLVLKKGCEIYESIDNPPLVSVNTDTIFDFSKNPKTDFEIAVFCAFCGLRSIIGIKPFVKTNNGLLMARMFGFRSAEEFEALMQKPKYYQDFFYTKDKGKQKERLRYQLTEKIIRGELCLSWGLKYYSSHSKGFYASFSSGFESLVLHAEKSRKSNLLNKQKQEQKRVIEQIKKQVRGK